MAPEAWNKLAIVLAAGGLGVFASMLAGTVIVPFCAKRMFVSRESKEGVASGRRDVVPMGGGFILLIGSTVVVAVFTGFREIRAGYAGLFLIAFWGFAVLGFLDDYSKTLQRGYGDKLKVVLQFVVLLVFSLFFYLYGQDYVPESDIGLLTLPFVGDVSLKIGYIPFAMAFLFYVSNSVNFTDGFNGLAGGVGAIVALSFAFITFLVGSYEIERAHALSLQFTQTGSRMFALSVMSAGLAGSCVAYLYFNYKRGCIFFGDTGSMALGAALAFLALFARAEFLMVVIGGVYFAEAASSGLQKGWAALVRKLGDPLLLSRIEPTMPFIMAPLHHHFEHLLTREQEQDGVVPPGVREAVRRRITVAAWRWSAAFAVVGVAGQYGRYGQHWPLFNWCCVIGLCMIAVLLGFGVATRLLYDMYFIGPSRETPLTLNLYRGIPLRLGGRRLYHLYQTTDIPLDRLGYLERRTVLYRLVTNRVDARTTFGLLHFGFAEHSGGAQRREHLRRALTFWEQVPRNRFREAQREEVFRHMAECHRGLGHPARAVICLEQLYAATGDENAVREIKQITDAALAVAEQAWSRWRTEHTQPTRAEALRSHEELLEIMDGRRERAVRVLERLRRDLSTGHAERRQNEVELLELEQGIRIAEQRCERLRETAAQLATGTGGS